MQILKRYKDTNGNTVDYGISAEGKVGGVSLEEALALQKFIDNAFVTPDKEYRAKSGHKIDTEVLHNSLVVRPTVSQVQSEKVQQDLEYYRKQSVGV